MKGMSKGGHMKMHGHNESSKEHKSMEKKEMKPMKSSSSSSGKSKLFGKK